MAKLVLFDIDGTLLLTSGAGRRAIVAALGEQVRDTNALDGVRFDGKTDPQIVTELLAAAGDPDPPTPSRIAAICRRYVELLAVELAQPTTRTTVMPGVRPLLDRLEDAGAHGKRGTRGGPEATIGSHRPRPFPSGGLRVRCRAPAGLATDCGPPGGALLRTGAKRVGSRDHRRYSCRHFVRRVYQRQSRCRGNGRILSLRSAGLQPLRGLRRPERYRPGPALHSSVTDLDGHGASELGRILGHS